ncbi:uncharacterized protein METZ01_LOCUS10144 [marine metagenome]|uniref:Uncharacterized protein n=1 Tax=marine metagenome TaxID=408172 RepID=A0A381NRV8_9ZZZZ
MFDDGIVESIVDCFSVFIEFYGRAKYLGIVDSADELPLSGHIPSVVASFGAPHRSGRARHNGQRIGNQFRAGDQRWRHKTKRFDSNHKIPTGTSVRFRDDFDDTHLG